jgi:tetratricopeptide (TPR) repeat protein
MNNPAHVTRNSILSAIVAVWIWGGALPTSRADQTNLAPGAETSPADAASAEALRSYLQLQEQLRATQMALERNRQEAETLASRNAEAVTTRLQLLEQAVSAQRARELEAMQSTNRLLLIMAGSFAGVGFIAMLLTAYLQWRAVNRLAEYTALLNSAGRPALSAAAGAQLQMLGSGTTEQSSAQLFGALNRLEGRIHELEHNAQIHLPDKAASPTVETPTPTPEAGDNGSEPGPSHVTLLLAKGQSLLSLDKASEALACYDEILALAPDNREALVKKGMALEQLRRIDEALGCYDRAIATDASLTIAYLQKGGLYNRLERYDEALQCYEQALRTQEKAQ